MLKVKKFASLDELNDFLQGAITPGSINNAVYGLGGLVLKLTTPAAICTFATAHNSAQESLTHRQIVDQINASAIGVGGVYARLSHGRVVLIEKVPTAGLVLASEGTGSTANTKLGYSASGSTSKVYGAPSGSDPRIVDISGIDNTNYLVTVSE